MALTRRPTKLPWLQPKALVQDVPAASCLPARRLLPVGFRVTWGLSPKHCRKLWVHQAALGWAPAQLACHLAPALSELAVRMEAAHLTSLPVCPLLPERIRI